MQTRHRVNGRPWIVTLALAAAFVVPSVAFGQEPASAPSASVAAPSLTANVGIFSQYGFRAIAQTGGRPAAQGGVDFSHPTGVYLGTWGSNISWLGDFGAYERSSLEWDIYGGYKKGLGESGATLDVGLLYYAYPGREKPGVVSADALEVYAGVGYKWATAKLSCNLKDYFGARPLGKGTDGTTYVDLAVGYPLGASGVTLLTHLGVLNVVNDGADDLRVGYTDWRLGASWVVPDGVLKSLEIGAYYTGNSSDSAFYTDLTGYDTAKAAGIVYLKKTM